MHHCSVISWPKILAFGYFSCSQIQQHYLHLTTNGLILFRPVIEVKSAKVEFQLHGGIVDAHKLRVHLLLTKSLKKENQEKCKAILESHPKPVLPELFFCLAITFTMKQGCADQYIPTLKSNLWIVVVDDLVLSTFKGHL